MDARRRRRPSPALILATAAFVVALGGSAAALPPGADGPGGNWKVFRVVGGPDGPAFGDGGQGDCLWAHANGDASGGNPPAFYRDPWDVVHLVGIAGHTDGPGGDGRCGADGLEDSIVFRLPPGYRPENAEILGAGPTAVLVVPDEGVKLAEGELPPGAVVPLSTLGMVILDGSTYRAAGLGTEVLETGAKSKLPSVERLRRLAR